MIDFEQHKIDPIKCIFAPREEFDGRALLPELREHIGETVYLVASWQMDDQDKYPGEWALVAKGGLIFGRTWIASGDFKYDN